MFYLFFFFFLFFLKINILPFLKFCFSGQISIYFRSACLESFDLATAETKSLVVELWILTGGLYCDIHNADVFIRRKFFVVPRVSGILCIRLHFMIA